MVGGDYMHLWLSWTQLISESVGWFSKNRDDLELSAAATTAYLCKCR